MKKPRIGLTETLVQSVNEKHLLSEAYAIGKDLTTIAVTDEVPPTAWQLYNIIMAAAAASAEFRAKVFDFAYPEVSDRIIYNIGYMNSETDLSVAMRSGFYSADLIYNYIDKYCDLQNVSNILDFGCGSMRVTRYLIQFAGSFKYLGCDVNPFSIEWAQSEFKDRATIFLMDSDPPLNLGDETVDLTFCWSVFSHYSEIVHKKWLTELYRILRPRGYCLVTIKSSHVIEQMISGKIEFTRADKADIGEVIRSYRNYGYGFYKCFSEDVFRFDVDNVGMALISQDYVRRNWTELFEIVRVDPALIGNWQDAILLRKIAR